MLRTVVVKIIAKYEINLGNVPLVHYVFLIDLNCHHLMLLLKVTLEKLQHLILKLGFEAAEIQNRMHVKIY